MTDLEPGLAGLFNLELAKSWDLRLHAFKTTNTLENLLADSLYGQPYSTRLDLFASALKSILPSDYLTACSILKNTFGPENPNETGTFKEFYWLLPVSRFVQNYGSKHIVDSLDIIEELTKRSTGEYAIRPLAKNFPSEVVTRATFWARSPHFHLRRLATEGLRPSLPWASKLTVYLETDLKPVLNILNVLSADPSKYVRKSVANHSSDYYKIDPLLITSLVDSWRISSNTYTQDIVKMIDRRQQKNKKV